MSHSQETPGITLTPEQQEALHTIAYAFYQANGIRGKVKMQFGVRSFPDSDGSGVVEVQLISLNQEAFEYLHQANNAPHMQFLETMIPISLLGYQFILHIEEQPQRQLAMTVLDRIAPGLIAG